MKLLLVAALFLAAAPAFAEDALYAVRGRVLKVKQHRTAHGRIREVTVKLDSCGASACSGVVKFDFSSPGQKFRRNAPVVFNLSPAMVIRLREVRKTRSMAALTLMVDGPAGAALAAGSR